MIPSREYGSRYVTLNFNKPPLAINDSRSFGRGTGWEVEGTQATTVN